MHLKSNSRFQTAPVLLLPDVGPSGIKSNVYTLVTGAGIQSRWHDMANGANMAFTKKLSIGKRISRKLSISSGDDIFWSKK
jgi:hypothetical protein